MTNQTTDTSREEGAKTPYGEALTKAIADGADEYSFAMGYRTALDIATKQTMPLSEDEAVLVMENRYNEVAQAEYVENCHRNCLRHAYRALAAKNTPTLTGGTCSSAEPRLGSISHDFAGVGEQNSCERCVQLEAALREAKLSLVALIELDGEWSNEAYRNAENAVIVSNAVLGEKAGV